MSRPLRLTALISGGGRTVCNLHDRIVHGQLDAEISLVIASREDCSGIKRARDAGLEVRVPDHGNYDDDLASLLDQAAPDLICLCGYLRKLRIDTRWSDRIINIHPSLLPRHGGKGMYGDRVHRAVLDADETVSGCTVHFVDDHYDNGPVLLQRACLVNPEDTVDQLADRVFQEECNALPEAIQLLAEQRVKIVDQRVEILPGITMNQTNL